MVLPGAFPGGAFPGGAFPGGALPGGALPGGALPGGALPGGRALPDGALPGAVHGVASTAHPSAADCWKVVLDFQGEGRSRFNNDFPMTCLVCCAAPGLRLLWQNLAMLPMSSVAAPTDNRQTPIQGTVYGCLTFTSRPRQLHEVDGHFKFFSAQSHIRPETISIISISTWWVL